LIVVFEVVENFEATEKQQISHLIKKNQEGRKKKKKKNLEKAIGFHIFVSVFFFLFERSCYFRFFFFFVPFSIYTVMKKHKGFYFIIFFLSFM